MKSILIAFASVFLAVYSFANNIAVSNSSISGQSTGSHIEKINFDVSWENSWRTSSNENNYDGAWIFVKFRKTGTSDWRHCTLNTSVFTAAAGSSFSMAADGKGLFIYRITNGTGNVNFIANQIQWEYGTDGVLDNETVEIKVFALEMVYIPGGSFYAGTNGTETNSFKNGSTPNPFLVTANTITFGTNTGNLNTVNGDVPSGNIPATYPTGINAFWIMKYECTQQQYVDFLNHLELAAANENKTPGGFTGTHPNLAAPNPERVIGQLGFLRTAALADWSCLRPYSELEYEKVCRGANIQPVPDEFAWGNTAFVALRGLNNIGLVNESVNNPANANVSFGLFGIGTYAVRAGLFARATGSDRVLSGGAYYGVMNMSDNFFEVTVAASTAAGLLFNRSVNGNGYLSPDGNCDIDSWIGVGAYGLRGGSYIDFNSYKWGRISDRNYMPFANFAAADYNGTDFTIRLARSAQ